MMRSSEPANVQSLRASVSWGDELLGRVQATKKVRLEDRPILAQNIGKAIEALGPGRLQVARDIFVSAWGSENSHWAKRSRYVQFADEEGPDPYLNGSYVSAGPTWRTLLEATARTIAGKDDVITPGRFNAALRTLVLGTEFLPKPPPLPTGIDGAQALIRSYAEKIEAKIATNTRLEELHRILVSAPFELVPARDEQTGYAGPSGKADKLGEIVYGTDIATKWLLAHNQSTRWTSWSIPKIHIGAVVKRLESRIFAVPSEMIKLAEIVTGDCEESYSEQETETYRAELLKWFESIGARWSTNHLHLPELSMKENEKFGWNNATFDTTRNVYITVLNKSDSCKLILEIEDDHNTNLVPKSAKDYLTVETIRRSPRWSYFLDHCFDFKINASWVRWPDWVEPGQRSMSLCSPGLEQNEIVGIVDPYQKEWNLFDVTGALSADDDDPIWSEILGADPSVRFISTLEEGDYLPVPCRHDSIAGALLRNLSACPEARLPNLLFDKAQKIGEAGCRAHEAIIEAHAAAIASIAEISDRNRD